MHACTIIARNYLAHARVLARSFFEHHPDGRFSVLVLDDTHSAADGAEPFDVVSPLEIGLDRDEFHRMAMIYDVLELATAVKPWFLRTLLAESADVSYFDPDIRVYAPLDYISNLARDRSIVLIPHTMDPIPRDGRVPSERTILEAGVFNLGFIAVGAGAIGFLDWWSERLARDCFLDPAAGAFVDQRWIDLVPGMFEHVILNDRGVDVAHWNLFARTVESNGDGYEVDGVPLRFYHFSGFDPERPYILSKHQGSNPRVLLSERPVMARLCREYAAELLSNGYHQAATSPYRYDRLPSGIRVDRLMRRLYRDALLEAERTNESLPPDPFDPADAELFSSWLHEPADEVGAAATVSRYLYALRAGRPDLQAAFPDLRWSDADRYLAWVAADGRYQLNIPTELLPRGNGRALVPAEASGSLSRDMEPGINIAGYFRAELGIGEAARQIAEGVRAAGVPFSTVIYEEGTSSRQRHPLEGATASEPIYDTNLICVNADRLLSFASDMGPDFFRGRYSIGVWWWEVPQFPRVMHPAFDVVDEIWVGSDHVRDAISAETEKPVLTIPIPVTLSDQPPLPRSKVKLPEGFLFLFVFDFFSVFERKNPLAVIDAFTRAFEPGEGPRLVIKSINGDKVGVALEALRAAAAGRPDVTVVDEYVSAHEKNSYMAACDCYVSLHRSEGFGLTMAEAMAHGKPVIATGYSGNLAFMTEDNSYLVPYNLTTIPPGCEPYPAGSEWAEPDRARAAVLMRRVYEHPEEARERGAQARRDILERQAPERLGEFVAQRLEEIRELRLVEPAREVPEWIFAGGGTPLARAAAYVARGPGGVRTSRSRFGAPVLFLRRVLNRLLFPYIREQHEIHAALVEVTSKLDERVEQLEHNLFSDDEDVGTSRRQPGLEAKHASELEGRLVDVESELGGLRELLVDQIDQSSLDSPSAESGFEIAELADRLANLELGFNGFQKDVISRIDQFALDVHSIAGEIRSLHGDLVAPPFIVDRAALTTEDASGREAIGYRNGTSTSSDTYREFENLFRGSEDFIRERQRPYLDLVAGRGPVLDAGCGRGEFLDLLREAGIDYKGIDLAAEMVEHCHARGHEVERADVNEYLERQTDNSLGVVFSAQLIEHLDYDELQRFLELAHSKLVPGGMFVAETVNPHSIRAFKTFWTDLSHRAPIFPEVAVALCRPVGFASAYVTFPQGTGELENDRLKQGEYALIATKADGQERPSTVDVSAEGAAPGNKRAPRSQRDAREFIEESDILWHQRFELAPGVFTSGTSDVLSLLAHGTVPDDLSGMRVLDIGTANGGAAFEAERRGAAEVVAIDIYPADWFGFDRIAAFLGSQVRFKRMSVYDLERLGTFDVVLFMGVLYHLRHPLLALDKLRRVLVPEGLLVIETAIADGELEAGDRPLVRFYRGADLAGDPSNWFAPTSSALVDWCASSGFEIVNIISWPPDAPARCVAAVRAVPGAPEFSTVSYEMPEASTPSISRLRADAS